MWADRSEPLWRCRIVPHGSTCHPTAPPGPGCSSRSPYTSRSSPSPCLQDISVTVDNDVLRINVEKKAEKVGAGGCWRVPCWCGCCAGTVGLAGALIVGAWRKSAGPAGAGAGAGQGAKPPHLAVVAALRKPPQLPHHVPASQRTRATAYSRRSGTAGLPSKQLPLTALGASSHAAL